MLDARRNCTQHCTEEKIAQAGRNMNNQWDQSIINKKPTALNLQL